MTVFAKLFVTAKRIKRFRIKVNGNSEQSEKLKEAVIDIKPGKPEVEFDDDFKPFSLSLVCLSLCVFCMIGVGVTSGVMIYGQQRGYVDLHRLQGYCDIPIQYRWDLFHTATTAAPSTRFMPLRWTAAAGSDDDDVQVFTGTGAPIDLNSNTLREELDIGEIVEKIAVIENGRRISFIHDFETNSSGIIDSGRCFTMELDPDVALTPDVFAMGLTHGDEFDVSHVRTTLRAALPALPELPELAALPRMARDLLAACADKPIYHLHKPEDVVVRKRSADEPPHDYIHFAGKHVQEIEINNLSDVLAYEKTRNSTA